MPNIVKKSINFITSLHQFLTRDIWRQDFSKLSLLRKFFYQQIMIGFLVVRSYVEDRLPIRAAALVYSTLLAIFPVLAISFFLLRGFGYHLKIEPQLMEWAKPFGDQVVALVPQIIQGISELNLRLFPILGFAVLLISIIAIVNNIERAFNDIWHIKTLRSFHRRFADLAGGFFFIPILIIGIPVINTYLQSLPILKAMSQNPGFVWLLRKATPFFISWFIFSFLYTVIPNTKVRVDSALIGAFAAGIAWQFANFYFTKYFVLSFQTGFKEALYSSFASLPIVLIWLYIAWTVVLLGAEISYAHQNQTKMSWELRKTNYSYAFKEELAIRILLVVAEHFQQGKEAPSNEELNERLDVPERLVNDVMSTLLELRLVYALEVDERLVRYVPAQSLERLKIVDIIQAIRERGVTIPLERNSDTINTIVENLEKEYKSILEKSDLTITVKDAIKTV